MAEQAFQALQAEVVAMRQRHEQTEATLAALTASLRDADARATRAEEERAAVIAMARHIQRDTDIVDVKGIGQPFKFAGKKDQDFSEWSHKLLTFIRSKFGDRVLRAMKWAARQRKTITADGILDDDRRVSYEMIFGLGANENDAIEDLERIVGHIYTYLISFTSGEANKVVRNAGEGMGLEAWRRLNGEYDPTSAMRRVAILGQVQNPERCDKVENLGGALEDWLSKKRQYEEYTDRGGEPCRVSEDSLMAAMYKLMPKTLEETVMFKSEDYDSFEQLFDKLVSYASTKHSLKILDRPRGSGGAKDPDAMDVSGLNDGKNKENIQCWVCFGRGHMGKDCPRKGKGKGRGGKGTGGTKGKSKGKGKGDGKGQFAGCYTCGGAHYASACPQNQVGKGKKGKGKGKTSGGGKGHPLSAVSEGAGGYMHQTIPAEDGWWQWQTPAAEADWWPDPHASSSAQAAVQSSLDVCATDLPGSPPYLVDYAGEQWVRFNYDSGAAATALPIEMAQGIPLTQAGEFMTANGAVIPNYGRVKLDTVDEDWNMRAVRGAVTEVHKPLCSASEMAKNHDAVLWQEGGFLIPKHGEAARRVREAVNKVIKRFGRTAGILPLYREGGLYNFYLKRAGPAQLAPLAAEGAAAPGVFRRPAAAP